MSVLYTSSVYLKSKVLGPLSEIFGRSTVLRLSNLIYLGTLCNRSPFILSGDETVCSLGSFFWVCELAKPIYRVSASCWVNGKCSVFRAFPFNHSHYVRISFDFVTYKQVGGGALGDLFDAEERGRAISIYSLAPLFEPLIGPVLGAWYFHFERQHAG